MGRLEKRMEDDGYITVARAAELSGRVASTVYRWCSIGNVEHLERAGIKFIELESLRQYVGEDVIDEALEADA